MSEVNMLAKNRKRNRLKICSFKDLTNLGYTIEKLKEEFKLNKEVVDRINGEFNDSKIIYKADNISGFIDYIEKIIDFEREYNKLILKFRRVKNLYIKRVEYERVFSKKEDVSEILGEINKVRSSLIKIENKDELDKLYYLEKEIEKEYLYAKDIELLKKMVSFEEEYNKDTQTKTVYLNMKENLNKDYIKPVKGTVEYHNHLKSDVPRIKRLIKNIDKYMNISKCKTKYEINQSDALGDSINIAVATFNDMEFKAISGKNDIDNYCKVVPREEAIFKSNKVNKLGELGVGYRRVNDSEKKIFEEIHKRIEAKEIKDKGELILYSKWEPCPSCLYVISQFCERYPKIDVKVKYNKKYGEK